MRRLLLKLLSVLLIIVLAACNTNPGTSTPEPTPTPAQDIPSAPPVDPVYELGATVQNASGNRQGVYYEIFVRSFADSDGDGIGDINGLI